MDAIQDAASKFQTNYSTSLSMIDCGGSANTAYCEKEVADQFGMIDDFMNGIALIIEDLSKFECIQNNTDFGNQTCPFEDAGTENTLLQANKVLVYAGSPKYRRLSADCKKKPL